jgi:hypothetical protein
MIFLLGTILKKKEKFNLKRSWCFESGWCTYEFFLLTSVLDPDVWLAIFADDFKGEMFNVGLHLGVIEFTTDETFSIENARVEMSKKHPSD